MVVVMDRGFLNKGISPVFAFQIAPMPAVADWFYRYSNYYWDRRQKNDQVIIK